MGSKSWWTVETENNDQTGCCDFDNYNAAKLHYNRVISNYNYNGWDKVRLIKHVCETTVYDSYQKPIKTETCLHETVFEKTPTKETVDTEFQKGDYVHVKTHGDGVYKGFYPINHWGTGYHIVDILHKKGDVYISRTEQEVGNVITKCKPVSRKFKIGEYVVPNFSNGQDLAVVEQLLPNFKMVVTSFVDGSKKEVHEAAFKGTKRQTNTEKALDIAYRFGMIGGHHKNWVIDQMVRALLGTDEAYDQWIDDYKAGEDGPETYEWDEGIAP